MNKKSVCFVFGAGEYGEVPPNFAAADFIIAADGGLAYLARHGVRPDLFVGDFDSSKSPPAGIDTIALPQQKDDTDMAAALREGWTRGFRIFHIYGGAGGRLDHTLANIQCLADLAGRGGRGYLHDRDTVITAIRDGEIAFPAGAEGTVSVFAHSDLAQGVCERGLAYPLENATLHNTRPLGISNQFTGARSSISVRSGTLLVIYPKGAQQDGGAPT